MQILPSLICLINCHLAFRELLATTKAAAPLSKSSLSANLLKCWMGWWTHPEVIKQVQVIDSLSQEGDTPSTVLPVSLLGRDVARSVIKCNDVEESMLLPYKGQVSTICARSWHFYSSLVQKYWTKKLQRQKKERKDTNQGHFKHVKMDSKQSIQLYHEDFFSEGERQLVGTATQCHLWVTMDSLFLITVGYSCEQISISSHFWKSHFLMGQLGSCLFW